MGVGRWWCEGGALRSRAAVPVSSAGPRLLSARVEAQPCGAFVVTWGGAQVPLQIYFAGGRLRALADSSLRRADGGDG